MKRKGFTLIELLAVIVILGLLMAIAIPSVTKYITQSRKKTLTNTIGNYMGALVNEVNDMVYTFTGTNTIYAVPIECIAVERGGTNPFGKWMQANNSYWAYVLVQYDDLTSSYKYGFTFKDSAGYGLYPTSQPKINEKGNQIVTGLNLSRPKNGLVTEITPLANWTGFDVDSTTKLKVLTAGSEDQVGDGVNTCTLVQKGDNYNQVEEEKSKLNKTFATTIIEKSSSDSSLYHHNGSNSYDANDGSYRYSGSNPDNYVCFGSDEVVCPEENLYRIIGVFGDNVKLIKNNDIGKHYYNSTDGTKETAVVIYEVEDNTYDVYAPWQANGKKVHLNTQLNGNLFFNKFDTKWQKMITNYDWKIGEPQDFYSHTGKDYLERESKSIQNFKIGLVTLSDYSFATDSQYWDTPTWYYDENAVANDWLTFNCNSSCVDSCDDSCVDSCDACCYDYCDEWTLSNWGVEVFVLSRDGIVFDFDGIYFHAYYNKFYVRPVFYLDSKVRIVSGTGTKESPYRLSM